MQNGQRCELLLKALFRQNIIEECKIIKNVSCLVFGEAYFLQILISQFKVVNYQSSINSLNCYMMPLINTD